METPPLSSHARRCAPAIERLEARIAPATFLVTTFADGTGAGTLRTAILDSNAAPGPDEIQFKSGGTLRLASDLPAITDDLVVGATRAVTIDGQKQFQIFQIESLPTEADPLAVTIRNLKLTNGWAEAGAAVRVGVDGTVLLQHLTITGNRAGGGDVEAQGGGVAVFFGTVTIEGCIISGNVADGGELGSAFGGGIANHGTLTLDQRTVVARNLATGIEGSGGGIFNADDGTLTVRASSLVANVAQGLFGMDGAAGLDGARGANATGKGEDGEPGEAGTDGEDATDAGSARGGAIFNAGALLVVDSTLSGNTARGGDGGDGGRGGDGGGGGRGGGADRETPAGLVGEGGSGGNGGRGGFGGTAHGGAIFAADTGSVTIQHGTLEGNSAVAGKNGRPGAGGRVGSGGAESALPGADGSDPAFGDPSVLAAGGGGIYSRSLLTVEEGSLITKNSVFGSNVIGGGIANDSVSATLIVRDSTIAGNVARGADGRNGLAGAAGVSGARGEIGEDGDSGLRGLRGGDAAHGGDALGGGIYTRGTATIERTTVAANLADGGDGGVGGKAGRGGNGGAGGRGARESFDGFTEIIPPGVAGTGGDGGEGGFGGAGGDGAGGGIYNHVLENFGGTLTVSDSTLAGNVTRSGAAGRGGEGGAAGSGRRDGDPVLPGLDGPAGQASEGGGGGLFSADGTLRIVQSTIAGNTAAGDGGGVKVGGIDGSATIRNSTIANNVAGGKGGGIFAGLASPTLPVELLSTIVAKNAVTTKTKIDPDLSGVLFARFNAIGLVGSAGLIGADNLLGIDPKLGPLKFNGGPTATMFPAAGSPVLGAGANPDALPTDQRGKPRVIGPAVDIGAVEA